MGTRTIVTSQPDVACDVCARRLLRGEQPDIFLAAGRRRTVCELCAPRAAHEGWQRERDTHSLTLPPMRSRRGRSFFERLRQVRGQSDGAAVAPAGSAPIEPQPELEPYDFLDGPQRTIPELLAEQDATAPEHAGAEQWGAAELHGAAVGEQPALRARGSYAEMALDVFNAGEYPRRVAGVARSLGAPIVNVRSAEHLESVVAIVVAWELCWYRYEVDLSEELAETRVSAQGTELGELAREERVANAVAGQSGSLSLLGAH